MKRRKSTQTFCIYLRWQKQQLPQNNTSKLFHLLTNTYEIQKSYRSEISKTFLFRLICGKKHSSLKRRALNKPDTPWPLAKHSRRVYSLSTPIRALNSSKSFCHLENGSIVWRPKECFRNVFHIHNTSNVFFISSQSERTRGPIHSLVYCLYSRHLWKYESLKSTYFLNFWTGTWLFERLKRLAEKTIAEK